MKILPTVSCPTIIPVAVTVADEGRTDTKAVAVSLCFWGLYRHIEMTRNPCDRERDGRVQVGGEFVITDNYFLKDPAG